MGNTTEKIKKGIKDAARAVKRGAEKGKDAVARSAEQIKDNTDRPQRKSRMPSGNWHAARLSTPASRVSTPGV